MNDDADLAQLDMLIVPQQPQQPVTEIDHDLLETIVSNYLDWNFDELTQRDQLTHTHTIVQELSVMIPQHVVMSNMDKIYTHTENLVYRKALRDPPVEIAPNLFVSCYPAVCNLRLLRNLGITHVVNAASGVCRSPFQRTGELQYLNLDLADSTDQNVADAIVFATDFLREALAHGNNNKVVIHCQAGISRSVTLCISWMIQHHRLTLRDALNSIRRFRPIANPNEYFIMQLEQLEQAVLNEQT